MPSIYSHFIEYMMGWNYFGGYMDLFSRSPINSY